MQNHFRYLILDYLLMHSRDIHYNINTCVFLLPALLFILLGCFGVSCRDSERYQLCWCLLAYIMEQLCPFPDIMTRLLKSNRVMMSGKKRGNFCWGFSNVFLFFLFFINFEHHKQSVSYSSVMFEGRQTFLIISADIFKTWQHSH